MSKIKRGRGRPHKWNPQIIAGWRYAKGASIAETARKWMVSNDTVKRACRDYGDGALEARHAWFEERWNILTDRLIFVFEKRGGYLPVVLNLRRRIWMLEAGLRETEAAMAARGIAYTPSAICKPRQEDSRLRELREMNRVFGLEDFDDDGPSEFDEWNLSPDQEKVLGW